MIEQLKQRLAELRQASNEAFAAWQQIVGRAEECAFLIDWQQREEVEKAVSSEAAASSEEAPNEETV
jgi:hypothetical protein